MARLRISWRRIYKKQNMNLDLSKCPTIRRCNFLTDKFKWGSKIKVTPYSKPKATWRPVEAPTTQRRTVNKIIICRRAPKSFKRRLHLSIAKKTSWLTPTTSSTLVKDRRTRKWARPRSCQKQLVAMWFMIRIRLARRVASSLMKMMRYESLIRQSKKRLKKITFKVALRTRIPIGSRVSILLIKEATNLNSNWT